jgi:hypothetical protein
MEEIFFKFLLILFGFFLGGVFPMCLSDCNWYVKIFFLIVAVHISENYWLYSIVRKMVKFQKSLQIYFFKWKFFRNLKKTLWDRNSLVFFILYFSLKIQNHYRLIKLGFFFGIFVDALKVGS